jgi:hypothetical protein
MANTGNVLDEARALLERRLADLDAERKKLERAISELSGDLTGGRIGRRKPGRPAGSKTGSGSAKPRQRRRRRGGTRADQAVKLVTSSPGITASEMAKKLKIKPNYLYRVMADLEKEGRVRKDGRKYFPAG